MRGLRVGKTSKIRNSIETMKGMGGLVFVQ